MKKSAFTLMELLIALTIIGVVAALTIPKIMDNVYQKSNIARLQTTYRELNDSIKTMMTNERVSKFEDSSLYDDPALFMDKYLKSIKSYDYLLDCYSDTYYTIDGNSHNFANSSLASHLSYSVPYQIPNGAVITFFDRSSVFIDVNGKDAPNTLGRDMFLLNIDDKGYVGVNSGLSGKTTEELTDLCVTDKDVYYGMPCFQLLQSNNWDVDTY